MSCLRCMSLTTVVAAVSAARPVVAGISFAVAASAFAVHSAHSRNIISRTPERERCWLPT
jgi:hypothetical protein